MPLTTVLASLFKGFGNTCLLFALTLVFSLPLGLVVSFGSMSRFAPLRWLTRTFVWIIRGSPLLLQIIIIFYGPGLLWSGTVPSNWRMTAAIIAFVINYSAYFSEIFRGGIQSIAHGQIEAGLVLGMTRRQIFFRVTLLQVIKRIVPPMSNEIITLVKDTALARVIAFREILMEAYSFVAKGLIGPLFYAGIFFLAFNGILTIVFGRLEKKLSYFK
jgi:polar amino acid transport system permease protein